MPDRVADRAANRRFWAGVLAFFALLAGMLGVGWMCAQPNPLGFVGLGDGDGDASDETFEHDRAPSFSCRDDEVVRQSPRPGTDLGKGGVVEIVTVCSDPLRPVGCA